MKIVMSLSCGWALIYNDYRHSETYKCRCGHEISNTNKRYLHVDYCSFCIYCCMLIRLTYRDFCIEPFVNGWLKVLTNWTVARGAIRTDLDFYRLISLMQLLENQKINLDYNSYLEIIMIPCYKTY